MLKIQNLKIENKVEKLRFKNLKISKIYKLKKNKLKKLRFKNLKI